MPTSLLDKKLDYWCHRLLDLGKRNRMINYRETIRSTMRLVDPEFSSFFERITINEESMTFQRAVDRETDVRVYSILSLLESLSSPIPVTVGDIGTACSTIERQKTLRNLRAKARLSLEEQGTNILYLSFGFLEWSEGTGASAQRLKSPLVLVPVSLTIKAVHAPYTLKKYDEDIIVNPTLLHCLQTEHGVTLPVFDPNSQDLDEYLKSLEPHLDQRGWRVSREVNLGLLSFLKISMYKDLLSNETAIKANPVIRAMAGDREEVNSLPPHAYQNDYDSVPPRNCYHVLSADSSQWDAVHYSRCGVSFVMQGPPGTGKSQTITNIIAEALAGGKKVLFVSEKMAALQVVHRRLQEVQLAEFCLPLHNYKASKRSILEQIGANLQLKPVRINESEINRLDALGTVRTELNQYAADLHQQVWPLGLTCYEAYGKILESDDAQTVPFRIEAPLRFSQTEINGFVHLLGRYSDSVRKICYTIDDNPWNHFHKVTSSFALHQQIEQNLTLVVPILKDIADHLALLSSDYHFSGSVSWDNCSHTVSLFRDLACMPSVPASWLVDKNIPQLRDLANTTASSWRSLQELRASVGLVFIPGIYTFDLRVWEHGMNRAAKAMSRMAFVQETSPSFYVVEYARLKDAFSDLSMQARVGLKAVQEFSSSLGFAFSDDRRSFSQVEVLLDVLEQSVTPRPEWFASGEAALSMLSAAVNQVKEVETLRKRLLENWEVETLAIDYEPILVRYKTDYQSVFKVFNARYKQDRKLIRSLSRDTMKRLDDDTAIKLLQSLKRIRESESWFDTHKSGLVSAFGEYYRGIDTDWRAIERALHATQQLGSVFAGAVPTQVIEAVSGGNRSESASNARTALERAQECFARMQEIAGAHSLQIDLEKDTMTAIADNSDLYVRHLAEFYRKYAQIEPYLNVPHSSPASVFDRVSTVYKTIELQTKVDNLNDKAVKEFAERYRRESTDWNLILDLLSRAETIQTCGLDEEFASEVFIAEKKAGLKNLAEGISTHKEACAAAFEFLISCFEDGALLQHAPICDVSEKFRRCLDSIWMLDDWIDFREVRDECLSSPISPFIVVLEKGKAFDTIPGSFLKGFYQAWLDAVQEDLHSVRKFRRNIQDSRVGEFKALDARQLKIAQMRIREKLISELPEPNRLLKANDELSILNRELGKKRKIMPLRRLFREIPALLQTLKPCFMMSPLTVSYFLETEAYHFDLVIFDEASQIFPEDAVGAIYRGSQVIIAGDSKQLPPTNFFAANTGNDDFDYDADEETEHEEVVSNSILEETASVLPNRTLLWHYRSRHEHLIAFSNREIYRNSLITFPNCFSGLPDTGVEYVHVQNGVYEGGGKNCNIAEAQRCVMLVLKHIQRYPDRSLGIIAFSEKQQTVIENEITRFRDRMPQYEFFFDESKEEPFFVKNLENVQGDERDTVIFSICYAKDKTGRMYMRFGPLGQDGGERRLNVAITRAKHNVKLVGSIQPADIDLYRTKSEGVRMLRSYIEFAQRGESALKPAPHSVDADGGDHFADYIAGLLTDKGYSVRTRVGCSDYKIDIVVDSPEKPGSVLAGIECDGLSYVQADTARDRDCLRSTILEGMGWNLYRVWSTEWIRNPQSEEQALLFFLQSCRGELGEKRNGTQKQNVKDDQIEVVESVKQDERTSSDAQSKNNPYGFEYYTEAEWFKAPHSGVGDASARIGEKIMYVLSVEQPIHLELLYKRMGTSFSAGKATEAVKRTIRQVIRERLPGKVKVDCDDFVFLPQSEDEFIVRVPRPSDSPRPMEYIHTAEVAKAMFVIIRESYGISVDELKAECARVFGFERRGVKIQAKTDAAVKYLVSRQHAKIIDDKLYQIGEWH